VYTELFGRGSEQSKQCEEDLLTYDSNRVREDTSKYMQFFKANNEKPTGTFCKLGRDCNTVDDIAQIQKPGGGYSKLRKRGLSMSDVFMSTYIKRK